MKHFYSSILWLSFLASLLGPGSLLAQRPQTIVYDANGKPERIAQEIVVRFDAAEMRSDVINDPYQASGTLDNFLSAQALDAISSASGRDMRSVEAWKVFPQLTTEQTTTLNQDSVAVPLDELWSILVLVMPTDVDETVVAGKLRDAWPVVRYAHMNWVGQLLGGG